MTDQPEDALDPEELDHLMPSEIRFPVVGIGASAGGLGAMMRFLENMPPDSGMAFVFIRHLSPDHESSAPEIFQRATKMSVVQVKGRTAIEANHVYVIPPSMDLTMDDGHLKLLKPTRIRGGHVAIDVFFRTLAQVHKERAVAIVMSGTGTDGAEGLARVKERGGITMAQRIEDAEYAGMPAAAIATGMVDFELTAANMPQRLIDLWANAQRIRLPSDVDPSLRVAELDSAEAAKRSEEALHGIMALLRNYSKNDFRHYKRATVLRRIQRRLQVNSLPDLPSYREYLDQHPEEAKPLLQDMLISVTNYFRDPLAFDALENKVIPSLLKSRAAEDPVRIWVAGCASGEEAYSISMLVRDQMTLHRSTSELQVFATDIDERAIATGRNALYPESIVSDVSPERIRQFFTREQAQLRVAKQVREKVLFAQHNVLRDPPFSRLDLVCCRNLLIYLDRKAQTRVLEMFRFALKPGGFLFLGTSESAEAVPHLFTVVDKKHRIYRANPLAHAIRHVPLLMEPVKGEVSATGIRPGRRVDALPTFAELHLKFIGQVVAPSVLIDAQHNILHLSENVGKYFQLGAGTPSLNLLASVQADLKTELRTALFQAAQSGKVIQTRSVPVRRGDRQTQVQLTVRHFGESGGQAGLWLVMFDELAESPRDKLLETADPVHQVLINQLENEIRELKQHLQENLEQAETSTEELKASNEELQAINEELRSASEELETSKEELQSINEELTTVNFELKVKVDETSKINDDLQNLITSADIAMIFVDRGLRIMRFTPQAGSIFSLIASDINRSLLDITHKLDYESLADDVADVLRTLGMTERQVSSSEGTQFLARIRPYRTTDDRIDGAVLTFVDVTTLRRAEEDVRAGVERLRIAAETTKDYAILTIDEDGLITTWNVGARRIFGYAESDILGQPFATLFTPEDRAAGAADEELRDARIAGRSLDERWHLRKDGTTFFASGVVTRLEGKAGGYAKIARDMTESQASQASREALLALEKEANQLKDQFLAVMSHELKHPLNLIQVNTELLISQPEVKALPAVIRIGESIRLAVASQTKIIDDLLDLSRARTGKLTLRLARVNFKEVTSLIVEAAREAAELKGVSMHFECGADDVLVFCDRVRTEQVLWNLINNAIKFTPANGKISITLACDEEFAKLAVADTGQGIDAQFLPHVFGMFAQAPNETISSTAGLGVGLTLVHDLTVAQGGKVFADSAGLNKGATFEVWLPLAKSPMQKKKSAASHQDLNGLKILVVDDMVELLEPFASLLRLGGAEVDVATGGQQALDFLVSHSCDLMISDLGMPYMDGYELIRKARKLPGLRALKAIALSGYGRQVDTVRALQSGFNAHLSKPATVAHICETIAQILPRNGEKKISDGVEGAVATEFGPEVPPSSVE